MRALIFEEKENCEFKEIEIGSQECLLCKHLCAIDFIEHTVKCKLDRYRGQYYDEFDKVAFLKEQVEQLNNQLKKG